MKQIFISTGIWAVCIMFFAGCMPGTLKVVQPAPEKTKKPALEFQEKAPNAYYFFVEALLQEKKGKHPAALKHLFSAIENDPDSLFLKNELGALYLDLGENRKALEVVNSVLAADPDNLEALIMYGRLNQVLKKPGVAARTYERILGIDPDKQGIYMLLGGIYMDTGDLHGALRTFRSLVDHFEDSYAGYFFLGKVFAALGNAVEAEKNFRKSLSLEPRLEEPRFELLKLYKSAGDREKTLGTYLDILKQNPYNARAGLELARFYIQNRQPDKAAVILKDLGRRSSTDTNIIRKIAQLYLEPEDYETVLALVSGMLRGAPENPDLHYIAAMAYDGVKNEEGAMLHFRQVGKDSRFYRNAVIHIAFLYHKKGEVEKAAAYLEDILEDTPANTDILMYLGTFYEDLGDYARAEQVLVRALEMDAENVDL
ncbi:MAG: hypothetical protein DRH32_00370, partial [Deltaproteobacteria bacterium]